MKAFMVTLFAFILAVTSVAANSLAQQSKDPKFSQVPRDISNHLQDSPNTIASPEEMLQHKYSSPW